MDKNKKKKLVREQLEETLQRFRPLLDISKPPKGWVRAIRNALGMSGRQLAERLNISRQRVAEIERDELTGSVTFNTMRRTAESLDCVFVYGFVPRISLEQTVRDRVTQVAEKRHARASQTMVLENQALSAKDNEKALSDMIEELLDTLPSNLWDE